MMDPDEDSRGVLHPSMLPSFHREASPPDLGDRIRWFWVPRWDLPPGASSRQEVLPFPASNLVVMPDGVTVTGPSTPRSHRDLTGSGWAVGALLRPGGVESLGLTPASFVDHTVPWPSPDLHKIVSEAMREGDPSSAVAVFVAWARAHMRGPSSAATAANSLEYLVSSSHDIVRVDQLATAVGMSVRSIQRLSLRYIGVPPLAVIRRFRLQEAARRIREDPSVTIAHVAADLGYADHAHLDADFRDVLGFTPSSYRRTTRGGGDT